MRIIAVISLLFWSQYLFSQINDSASNWVQDNPVKVQYKRSSQAELLVDTLEDIESQDNRFHRFNATYFLDSYKENLGNLGAPSFSMRPDPIISPGYTNGFNHFDDFRFQKDDLLYFNTYTPFARLNYFQGPNQLQFFDGYLSRNINKESNITIRLRRLVSNGHYFFQRADHFNGSINAILSPVNKRFTIITSLIFNKMEMDENGGILSDSSFYEFGDLAPTNMQGYKNLWRDADYNLKFYYRLGRMNVDTIVKKKDTLINPQPAGKFYTGAGFRRQSLRMVYKDDELDTNYFTAYNYSENRSFDWWQHFLYTYEGFVGKIHAGKGSDFSWSGQAGLRLNTGNYYIRNNSFSFADLYLFSTATVQYKNHKFSGDGSYYLPGSDNANDYSLQLDYQFHNRSFSFDANQNFVLGGATVKQTFGDANHIAYSNDFEKVYWMRTGASLTFKAINSTLGAENLFYRRYIYFSRNIVPEQQTGNLNHQIFWLRQELQLGIFNLHHRLSFQRADSDLIRFPDWMYRGGFFVRDTIFKGNFVPQVGIDFRYHTAFKAYAYYPQYSIFYLQDEVSVGNYPMFDFYISGRIKNFMGFIKIEHVTQGLFGDDYFSSPYYPEYGRQFVFGISWTFYD